MQHLICGAMLLLFSLALCGCGGHSAPSADAGKSAATSSQNMTPEQIKSEQKLAK
jgi:hypothetical protein